MESDTRLEGVITAIADPTRRAVIELLQRQPLRAGELAAALGMTPPALSRHLRLLRESGVVLEQILEEDARVRVYCLQPTALEPLTDWLEKVERFWSDQLGAFKRHAESKPPRK